jgi:hypothetical protein
MPGACKPRSGGQCLRQDRRCCRRDHADARPLLSAAKHLRLSRGSPRQRHTGRQPGTPAAFPVDNYVTYHVDNYVIYHRLPPPAKKAQSPLLCVRSGTPDASPGLPSGAAVVDEACPPQVVAAWSWFTLLRIHDHCLTGSAKPNAELAMIIRWCPGVKRNGSWFKGGRTEVHDQKGGSGKTDIRDSRRDYAGTGIERTGETVTGGSWPPICLALSCARLLTSVRCCPSGPWSRAEAGCRDC